MTVNATGARRRAFRIAALAFTALAPALFAADAAQAQTETADKAFAIDIPAQTLARSMAALSTQTGVQVVYDDDAPLSVQAPAVKGRMTVEQALARITAGTGFTYRFTGAGVVTLVRVPVGNASDGELVTGVVSVEGYQGSPYFGGAGVAAGVNGINGSRDITATEGTGSFTSGALTIGSKVPQAMKDVPQSVSVLTSERLEQQNVTDFTDAMRQLPGVTLVQGSTSLQSEFYSRGFEINSIQLDGGAPLSRSYAAGNGYFLQIDMSQYDHVELLRGADGLFNGYGNPGGTVNLVRKKPLDHSQFLLEAQAGNWNNYRVVADATSPLALDGKLRGRLVMTYQDNQYFYDTARDNKSLIYGVAELDVSPTTLVTGGISYTKQDSVPWQNGLPRYWNGGDLELPRSTCLCFDWNRWAFKTREIFGGVEQKIGRDWTLKVNLTQNHQTSTKKMGYIMGPGINPADGTGLTLGGQFAKTEGDQLSAEAVLSGTFDLFGQRQEITIGANRVHSDAGGQADYEDPIVSYNAPYQPYPGGPVYCPDPVACPAGSAPPFDVLSFDPLNPLYNEFRNPLQFGRLPVNAQTQLGAYFNLRLTAFDRLHLTTGLRWSRIENKSTYEGLCSFIPTTDPGYPGSCFGQELGDVRSVSYTKSSTSDVTWPPSASLSFDITKQLIAYVGYSDIYVSQANNLDVNRNPVDPITGSNWEAGLKWATRDDRLNLSLAAYRIKQQGFARIDPPDYSEYEDLGNGVSCCYISNPDQILISKGIDFEATGEIRSGWQISASFNYNTTKQEGAYFGGNEGEPFKSIQPKNIYRLWTSYDFGAAGFSGPLAGLTVSLGLNGQSSAYYSGYVCTSSYTELFPGFSVCDTTPERYEFTVPAYIVASGRVDYRISDKWSVALNLENIFDKTYYQTVGADPSSGNWYGAPRSVTASLRAKW